MAERLVGAGMEVVPTGSPYAVPPGSILNRSGSPYKVFTPFSRAWREHGAYVRRWVPELSSVATRWIHTPGESPEGLPSGYPAPIVDHREEREEPLRRYEAMQ